jgi:hypothetical protein
MGSYASVSITPGVGAPINTFLKGSGFYDQVFRAARAQSSSIDPWTISTTASLSEIAADANRVSMMVVVDFTATARVFFRTDNTAPTAALYSFYLDPGERWEVAPEWSNLPLSMVGTTAVGTVLTTMGVAS